jgi:hypothetical protein
MDEASGAADAPIERAKQADRAEGRAANGDARTARLVPLVVSLAVLAVLVELWLEQHANVSIAQPGYFAAIVAAVAIGFKVADYLLGKGATEGATTRVQSAVRALISVESVGILWVAAALLMLTRSSIEIVGDSPAESGHVTATPAYIATGRDADFGPDLKAARFPWVETSPFGRRYSISADGYVSASFVVYPITGLRLVLDKDLVPSPSVLFRPDPSAFGTLGSSGSRIKVSMVRGTTLDSIAGGVGAASFLLGRAQPIPAEMLQDWQLELATFKGDVAPDAMLGWRHPILLASHVNLQPGAKLVAEVFSRGNNCAGRAEVVLHTEKLIDVEIPGGPCTP